jgi:hypothetical protein
MAQRRIGELLVADGLVSEAALARALEFQRSGGRSLTLGGIFLNWGLLGEGALLEALAKLHACPAIPWASLSSASPDAVRLLSAEQAIRIGAMPYAADKRTVQVAFANPSNLAAIDEVAAITKRRVLAGVTSEVRLLQAHQRFYARTIPVPLWAIVQKLDRKPEKPPVSAVQAPPPPRAQAQESSSTPPETILALAGPAAESLDAAQPRPEPPLPGAEAPPAKERVDPYSDQYSLTDFVAEALTVFGGLPDSGEERQARPDPDAMWLHLDEAIPSVRLSPDATHPTGQRERRARRRDSLDSTQPS